MNSRVDRVLTAAETWVTLISYLAVIVLVGGEAGRRIITGSQAMWAPELALYAFACLSWMSMSSSIRSGQHLAFRELREKLPRSMRRAAEALDCVLWLIIGSIVLYGVILVLVTNVRLGQVIFGTAIPAALANLAVLLGWALSIARALQNLWCISLGQNRSGIDGPLSP